MKTGKYTVIIYQLIIYLFIYIFDFLPFFLACLLEKKYNFFFFSLWIWCSSNVYGSQPFDSFLKLMFCSGVLNVVYTAASYFFLFFIGGIRVCKGNILLYIYWDVKSREKPIHCRIWKHYCVYEAQHI